MKFKCGPDEETKYRLGCAWAKKQTAYLKDWHDFFALWPRKVGNYDCRWLETIERRYPKAEQFGSYVGRVYDHHAEYRAKPEKSKDKQSKKSP